MNGARLRRWVRRMVSTWVEYMMAWVSLGLRAWGLGWRAGSTEGVGWSWASELGLWQRGSTARVRGVGW